MQTPELRQSGIKYTKVAHWIYFNTPKRMYNGLQKSESSRTMRK